MLTKENFCVDFIVTHLNYKNVERSIRYLRERTPKENLGKIIFINQSGNDYPWAKDLVDIHIQIENQGFSRANNLGIRLSDSEFVACMNDDVEIMNPKYIEGIIETFNRYSTALCVSPASPRNPACSGCAPIDHPGYEWRENWDDEIYNKLLTEVGKSYVIDGICMFFPIFRREMLEKLPGSIPGKCYFDEYFFPGGGDDYDMNRRAYLSGMRCLGTNLSYIYHFWYSTIKPGATEPGVKYDGGLFDKKWGIWENEELKERPDIYGKMGKKEIPLNQIRNI